MLVSGLLCLRIGPNFARTVKLVLLVFFLRDCITCINRSQNVVADYLANFARTEKRIIGWLGSGSPGALHLSRVDCDPDIG